LFSNDDPHPDDPGSLFGRTVEGIGAFEVGTVLC
jgi:hypothetical protein